MLGVTDIQILFGSCSSHVGEVCFFVQIYAVVGKIGQYSFASADYKDCIVFQSFAAVDAHNTDIVRALIFYEPRHIRILLLQIGYIFQKLCQRCVLFRRVQYISKDTNIYNDDKYVDELFYEYGNNNSRESYPLEARANVIVSCLYLSGYANYFAVDATRTPAAQQKIRMYEMKEGLLNVVKTKKPFASLLQP